MRNLNSMSSLPWSLGVAARSKAAKNLALPAALEAAVLHFMKGCICTLVVQPLNPKLKPSSNFNIYIYYIIYKYIM